MPYFVLAVVAALAFWALQQCSMDWTPNQRSAENAPSKRDVRLVFSDSDYPAEAQQNGEEGTVRARLDIDASGRVARCTVIRSSGHALLDSATCNILRSRARFAPARDRYGNVRPDSYVTPPITWRLAE
jgi:protein TonB